MIDSAARRHDNKVSVERFADFVDRIDVRSPSEYHEDHLPNAENHPVLDDEQRARIGTMHAQASAFAARRAGAALVARSIAAMIETSFAEKPREWAPLVYCWRGGQRSRSIVHVLNEIGWRAVQLEGGYRAYRRRIVARLLELPGRFRYEVVCGLTGSGKSRLIGALAREGAQVLDLETMARHRGSLLGDFPDRPQPTQKSFDTQLVAALERFDPSLPVYVESESRKIGTVQLPDALLDAMRTAPCIRVVLPRPLRIQLLKDDYAHFFDDQTALSRRLERLVPIHGRKQITHWMDAAKAGDWDTLVSELLELHYDPMYRRSIERNFPRIAAAIDIEPPTLAESAFRALARELDERVRERVAA